MKRTICLTAVQELEGFKGCTLLFHRNVPGCRYSSNLLQGAMNEDGGCALLRQADYGIFRRKMEYCFSFSASCK